MPTSWSETYVIGGYDYPPFIHSNATQGIYVDIMEELALLTEEEFKWEHYPYARLDALFTKARVHIEVGSSPLWTKSKPIPGFYTKSFYALKDVAVFRKGEVQSVKYFSDLKDNRVGLVRGYSFPQFQQAFDDGLAVRVDAANEATLMKLLVNNRVDQIFISKDLFLYHKKMNNDFFELVSGDEVGSYNVAIRVHPAYKELVEVLDEGIKTLIERGRIKEIIRKHL
jgi:polar amino acid transport system substrate-binding protein